MILPEVAHHPVDVVLHGGGLALTACAVDGDQHQRVRELHPLAHGLGREAAEDDVVRRADPCAGEHRDNDLGDHRQVDPDDVALGDAEVLQRVGEPLDVGQQAGVGQRPRVAVLAVPVERDPLPAAGGDVAVQAGVRDVQLAACEPFVERRVRVVQDCVPRREPVELPRLLLPPALPVGVGLLIDRPIAQQRLLAEGARRVEAGDVEQPGQLLLELVVR